MPASAKRFYCERRTTEGMGGGSVFWAVTDTAPAPAVNLTAREVDPATPLSDWAVKDATTTEPPAYTPS